MEILAVVISIAFVALTFVFLRRRSGSGPNLPPGSFGWPIVGESIEFLFGKPEKFVGDRMKKYSPDIFKTKILGEKTAIICGPNGHKFLFSNEQKYFTAFRPHPMQHLFRSYKTKEAAAAAPPPPSTKSTDETKAIRQPGFLKPEALMRFLAAMDGVTKQQLHVHCAGKDVVEAYPLSKTITLTLACQFFLGINNPERIARLVKYFDDVTVGMHCIMLNVPGTIFYRANKAATAIRKELIAVIKEKKEAMASGAPLRDILSHMIVATDPSGKSMPEPEIVIPWSLNVFAEQMAIAETKKPGEFLEWEDMAKMKYSWNVICETMRLVPPLQGTFRDVLTEFTYAGRNFA